MAGKTIIMSKLKQVVRLRANGVALQTIAKAVSLSRNTVKKYVRLIEVKELDSAELLLMEDEALEALLLDPAPCEQLRLETLVALFPYFEKELKRVGVLAGYYGANIANSTLVVIAILKFVITTNFGRSAVQAHYILNMNLPINSSSILRVRRCNW